MNKWPRDKNKKTGQSEYSGDFVKTDERENNIKS